MGKFLEQLREHRLQGGWTADLRYELKKEPALGRPMGAGRNEIRQSIIGQGKDLDLESALVLLNNTIQPTQEDFTFSLFGVAGIVLIMAAAVINDKSDLGVYLTTRIHPFCCSIRIGNATEIKSELYLRSTSDKNPHGFPALTL